MPKPTTEQRELRNARKENSELHTRLINARKESSRTSIMEHSSPPESTKWMIFTATALGCSVEVKVKDGKLVYEAVKRERA